MEPKFTIRDVENFFECKAKMEWVNRIIFDYSLRGYKKADISDFDGSTYRFKLKKKNEEMYLDALVDNENFVIDKGKGLFPIKDYSDEWARFIHLTVDEKTK